MRPDCEKSCHSSSGADVCCCMSQDGRELVLVFGEFSYIPCAIYTSHFNHIISFNYHDQTRSRYYYFFINYIIYMSITH